MSLEENIFKVAEAICAADNGGDLRAHLNAYGQDHPAAQRYWRLAIAAIDADSRFPGGSREVRELRWKAKNLGRQLGRAGAKIHQLRAEVVYAYSGTQIDTRGYHVNLERMRAAEAEVLELRARIKELEAIRANSVQDFGDTFYQDTPEPVDLTIDGGSTAPVEPWHGKASTPQ
jgi:hypothetical protein